MKIALKYFNTDKAFQLENGGQIDNLRLAYRTYGKMNTNQSNVIWVFHAFSGSSNVMEWWKGLFGQERLYSPDEYFIICVNSLASPYGSSRPDKIEAPLVTVRDVVRSQQLLAKELAITKIHTLIGPSYGGSQALEFAYTFSGDVEHLVLISCAARESAWSIAIHEVHRMALLADPTFGNPGQGKAGMRAARAMGLMLYRTRKSFLEKHSDLDDRQNSFSVSDYLAYQGEKFAKRFDALCYYHLSLTLDTHHLGRARGGVATALAKIKTNALVIGVGSDELIPASNQAYIARYLPNAVYNEIESDYGHDAFLVESDLIAKRIRAFYDCASNNGQEENRLAKRSCFQKAG